MTDVTGEPFPALLKRLVLDPVGMTNSGYDQPALGGPGASRQPRGYRPDGKMVEDGGTPTPRWRLPGFGPPRATC
ncbi:MAG: hypothetical protein IPK33_22700 [Gemmatimonadetes bacterium]|nr:hypothetical protein [Gemmatimonadota bacterium]